MENYIGNALAQIGQMKQQDFQNNLARRQIDNQERKSNELAQKESGLANAQKALAESEWALRSPSKVAALKGLPHVLKALEAQGVDANVITEENATAFFEHARQKASVALGKGPENPYKVSQQPGPNGSTILTDGKRFDVVAGKQPDGQVSRQLTTRPVANGKVQDFGYNPRTNQLEPVGLPYDSDPGGVNSRKGAMPLRKEFRNLDSVKNYETVLPLIKSAEKAPDTGYGDLQLIYTVGKTLDPGSVVREGELALTIAAGSPLQRVLGATRFNFEKGGRLTPQQRGQIIEMLNQRVAAAKTAYERDFSQYSQYAKESGVDPSMVVGNEFDKAYEAQPAEQPEVTATGPNGQKIVLRNGRWVPR